MQYNALHLCTHPLKVQVNKKEEIPQGRANIWTRNKKKITQGRANIWTRAADDKPDSPLLFKVGDEPGTAPLRFSYLKDPSVPLGVPGECRFRAKLRVEHDGQDVGVIPRCIVNPRLPALLDDIDNALQQIKVFIRALETEGAKLYGKEGYNAGMERALRAMNYCFDWTQWVVSRKRKGPCPDHNIV